MHFSNLKDPNVRCMLIGPGYLPFIKTELTLSDMQKTPILLHLVWLEGDSPAASRLLPRQQDGCT